MKVPEFYGKTLKRITQDWAEPQGMISRASRIVLTFSDDSQLVLEAQADYSQEEEKFFIEQVLSDAECEAERKKQAAAILAPQLAALTNSGWCGLGGMEPNI
jgi:hypothetical protein